jgi:hypothetical protein
MSASSVRDLARRHAVGELSLEDYRTKRHTLIDDIINGKQPLTYGEYRPARVPRAHLSSRMILFAGIAIGVIIIATLTVLATSDHTQAVSTVQQASPPAQAEASETTPGPLLIADFLNSNDWSKASIENFIQQWNGLPRKERELAEKNYRYPRLISELRQQIVSQQAMSGLTKNPNAAKTQLASLRNMANMLGVESDN